MTLHHLARTRIADQGIEEVALQSRQLALPQDLADQAEGTTAAKPLIDGSVDALVRKADLGDAGCKLTASPKDLAKRGLSSLWIGGDA